MSILAPNPIATTMGLLGRKVGMTRIFTEEGTSIPVTVLDVSSNRVTHIKLPKTDGYTAVQLTQGQQKASRIAKPQLGHYTRAGVESGRVTKEFRLELNEANQLRLGAEIAAEFIFKVGQKVDVTGTTIGKGFSGTIKRHHFGAQRNSHGNSRSHRVPGSIGQAQDPGRVLPGKRMPGQLGGKKRTVQNLPIIRIDTARGLLLIQGAIPGCIGSSIAVYPSVKNQHKKGV